MTSASGKLLRERVEHDFAYHTPTGNKPERHHMIVESGKVFAHAILSCCPDSREASLALTKVEEAVFWADASIAREET